MSNRVIKFEYGFDNHAPVKMTLNEIEWFNQTMLSNQMGRIKYRRQFTGLHDKTGQEVYEGDIVASPHFIDAAGREHVLKHVVEWSEKYHGWFLANAKSMDGTGSIQIFVAREAELEVIGNIHENKELLS